MTKMVLLLFYFGLLYLSACASHQHDKPLNYGLELNEMNPDKKTALVKQNLLHLAQVYDLKPVLFSKQIVISSNPVTVKTQSLLISTAFADAPNKLLSQLLHVELHAWMLLNRTKLPAALADLKKIYPKIPAETLPGDKVSGHIHLIICYLELELLGFYLGKKQSNAIISELMKKDKIFPWTYYQVLNKNYAIKQVVERHQLLPPPLI